jgi:uncharacterized protein (DUF1499 family)
MPFPITEVVVAETFPSLTVPAWPGTLTRLGVWLLIAGAVLAVIAGPVHRFGLAGFQPALLLLAGGALLLVLGALLAIVGFLAALAKGTPVSKGATALAIVVGLGLLGYLLSWLRAGMGVPPIHEISTDLQSPPPFVALREIRAQTPGVNPVDYVTEQPGRSGTINVPQAQRSAYPDIQPLQLALPPAEAFTRVESAARSLGWEIVASVPEEGRLEATETTRFFGFKDDIVVRLRVEGGGTRVDVRSKSRVGVGDVGANAARIRKFLAAMGSTS